MSTTRTDRSGVAVVLTDLTRQYGLVKALDAADPAAGTRRVGGAAGPVGLRKDNRVADTRGPR